MSVTRPLVVAVLAILSTACTTDRIGDGEASTISPWPGADDVRTLDERGTFAGNLSGLVYDVDDPRERAVLWAVRNYPGTLFRLVARDGRWVPDTTIAWRGIDWRTGRRLRFADGTGDVDAEGLTLVGQAAFIASERDNDADTVSRNLVLRYQLSADSGDLLPTHTWDLTADLPAVAPNKGIEAIAYIPDAHLVEVGFRDAQTNAPYDPLRYPEHGDGLIAVGLEADGAVYVYALSRRTSSAVRVAVMATGMPSVMALEYDADTRQLWAHCDDVCENEARVFMIDAGGQFALTRRFARPTTLPNANHEGFTIAPRAACVNGRRPVLWADDSETGGHAIRGSTLPCTPVR